MFPSYTAIDLIRTMNEELAERHRQSAYAYQWDGATAGRSPATGLRRLVRRGRA